MTPGTMTAARHPQVPATSPVMAPANEAPKHQVARLMLITRPRRCAGQVSATSIDPSDHSPLVGKARPEIKPGDAEGEPDLKAGPIGRDGERELLDDQR